MMSAPGTRSGAALVVGAGAVGLSTALELLESGAWDVHVVADKLSPETTSDGSGGYWRPVFLDMEEAALLRISEYSFSKMVRIMQDHGSTQDLGMRLVSGYEFYKGTEPPTAPCWSKVVLGFRSAEKDEIRVFCPHATHGFFYTTILVEPPKYLKWIQKRIKSLGGVITRRNVESLAEASQIFVPSRSGKSASLPSIVVNCAGLHGGKLAGDDATKVVPIRGQIMRVKPTLPSHSRHFLLDLTVENEVAYILPRDDCCILGGTEQVGDYNTLISEKDTHDIITKCDAMMPGLRQAEVLGAWAGLRPARDPVRMQLCTAEKQGSTGLSVPVLHNYGHGGSGLTIHFGCARECLSLLRQAGLMAGSQVSKL